MRDLGDDLTSCPAGAQIVDDPPHMLPAAGDSMSRAPASAVGGALDQLSGKSLPGGTDHHERLLAPASAPPSPVRRADRLRPARPSSQAPCRTRIDNLRLG